MKCERDQYSQSTILYNVRCRFRRLASLIGVAAFVGTAFCPTICAQKSNNDGGAPNMSGVTDVTPGWKYLLQNKDLAMLQVNTDSGVTSTSLVSMETSKSALSGTPLNIPVAKSNISTSVDTTNSILAAEAAGRMFNTSTDAVGVLSVYGLEWAFSVANSTSVQAATKLNASFAPNGTVYTQVVMGDFNGDGLADPLAFYTDTNFNGPVEVRWGIVAITAYDPTKPCAGDCSRSSAHGRTSKDCLTSPPRRTEMPLIEVVQTRQISASIRLSDTTANQVDQYAAFIGASADEVVEQALAYVFSKDRDFQEFLKSADAQKVTPTLRIRKPASSDAELAARKPVIPASLPPQTAASAAGSKA